MGKELSRLLSFNHITHKNNGGRRNLAEQKCWHNYLILTLLMLILDVTKAFPVSELVRSTEAEVPIPYVEPPPKPFRFKYEAGRDPGGSGRPDRYVEQEGDGTGQIRGSYTYLDPNWTWQTIKYMADPDGGFRILEGSTLGVRPKDTAAVQKAREEHEALFKMIALKNQQQPVPVQEPVPLPLPQETRAVQHKRRQHAELFQKIAEEHRLLAEEHKRLA